MRSTGTLSHTNNHVLFFNTFFLAEKHNVAILEQTGSRNQGVSNIFHMQNRTAILPFYPDRNVSSYTYPAIIGPRSGTSGSN